MSLDDLSHDVVPLLQVELLLNEFVTSFSRLVLHVRYQRQSMLPQHELPPVCEITLCQCKEVFELVEFPCDFLCIDSPWAVSWLHVDQSMNDVEAFGQLFFVICVHHPIEDLAS